MMAHTAPLRGTLIGEVARVDGDRDTPSVDTTAMLESLLLFDSYVMQSARLTELPVPIREIGCDNVLLVLESVSFSSHGDATVLAQTGQTITESRHEKDLLPWCSYAFSSYGVADRSDFLEKCFAKVRSLTDLTSEQFDRLEAAVRTHLVSVGRDAGLVRLETFKQDILRN